MTIFSAVMPINDRPPCISYTRAALRRGRGEGPGRFPISWGTFFQWWWSAAHEKGARSGGQAPLRICACAGRGIPALCRRPRGFERGIWPSAADSIWQAGLHVLYQVAAI
jgi:hypothetical protein